ncbi:sigma-70 family RNA polymerase sigma factor [Rosistilla ulvae]|nr:sigma-70 family RNA polymerase sigma factor [Rosistilla ulvae]
MRFVRQFDCHEAAIRAYVRRLIPSRIDADDVVQEVAVVLWEKLDDFDEEGNFRSWAFSIARFKALAWIRDKGRQNMVLDMDVVSTLADEAERDESDLERQRHALRSCLKKLPAEQRRLVANAYHRDARMEDLAASSGRSAAGFYQWLYRTRQILLECIQRQLASEANK